MGWNERSDPDMRTANFCDVYREGVYRDRVATTEVQNAWSSRDSRRLQIVPGSALAGNSNCKNRVTELRFLVISRQ